MTSSAGNREVGTREREACIPVTHRGEHGGREGVYAVTEFTVPAFRGRGELGGVHVFVAGCARGAGAAVCSVLAAWLMTRTAGHRDVTPVERVGGRRVRAHV